MEKDLSAFSTEEIARELSKRGDIVRQDGLISPAVYEVRKRIGAITSVDGIGIRLNGSTVKGGLIERNTGQYTGKLCLVGGAVALAESVEAALRRHFRSDIGTKIEFIEPLGWQKPTMIRQYFPPNIAGELSKDFLPDPAKHSIGLTYIVRILADKFIFGQTAYGQEARKYYWFSLAKCPPDDDFGYGQGPTFRTCLQEAEKLLKG